MTTMLAPACLMMLAATKGGTVLRNVVEGRKDPSGGVQAVEAVDRAGPGLSSVVLSRWPRAEPGPRILRRATSAPTRPSRPLLPGPRAALCGARLRGPCAPRVPRPREAGPVTGRARLRLRRAGCWWPCGPGTHRLLAPVARATRSCAACAYRAACGTWEPWCVWCAGKAAVLERAVAGGGDRWAQHRASTATLRGEGRDRRSRVASVLCAVGSSCRRRAVASRSQAVPCGAA